MHVSTMRTQVGIIGGGPSGLLLYEFRSGVGYDNEFLAVHHGEDFTWVARCQNEADGITPTCLRDINLGESLSVRYRFALTHLAQWQAIESIVRTKVSEFLLK